jgi:Ca2+-binding RTX toxin-like protein
MADIVVGPSGLDMNHLDFSALLQGTATNETSTQFVHTISGQLITFVGAGFTYDASGVLTGGVISDVTVTLNGQSLYSVSGANITASTWLTWAKNGDTLGALKGVLAGADTLTGSDNADTMGGVTGDDSISAGGGNDLIDGGASGLMSTGSGDDTINGGAGDDAIVDEDGKNFLQGGDGNDQIVGGSDFDRTNGNTGNDTVHGNDGNDWVTGGKDQDVLFGDNGDDILNGNLGNDTGDGGAGNDTVRGGQGDDVLSGGDGNDYMTGDLGNDTMTGGSGADTFRAFNGGGHDVITDFNAAEGDRVQLDAGATYTVSQVGADTVIDLGGGNQTVLSGVTLTALPAGWIVGA